MRFGLVIIGDEILSGKRKDKHFESAVGILARRGLSVSVARYLPDDPDILTATFRRTLEEDLSIFSFGGIGATPDDHTRQCVARAAGVDLAIHEDAKREIEGQFGPDAYPHRINMGMFPIGSRIIPNSFNRIPGFSFSNHHFLPGFPSMAWSMMEWVLDNEYQHVQNFKPDIERSILVIDAPESELIPVMESCIQSYAECKVFSLPTITEDRKRRVELGVRGPSDLADKAIETIKQEIEALGFVWKDL